LNSVTVLSEVAINLIDDEYLQVDM